MKILMIGSGGREHALVKKLLESPKCTKLYCAPANGGISRDAEAVNIGVMDKENMVYIYNEILFSHKKTEILSLGTARMDVGSIMLSEIRQRKTNVALSPLYMESEEKKTKQKRINNIILLFLFCEDSLVI